MPKLPDAYALGARPGIAVPQAVQASRAGLIEADAILDLGGAVNRAAVVQKDREDKFAFAAAKGSLLQADIEARRELENDQDWATYESRYRERMGKAREQAIGQVRSKYDRRVLELESQYDLERGAAEIRGAAKAKEVDWGRATLESQLASLREAALNAKDEPTRAAIVRNSQELIEGSVERGYVKAEEAGTVQRSWAQAYGEGVIAMLPVEQQIAMLKKPVGTPADFIDPAKRAVLLEQAEREQKQEQRAQDQEARSKIAQSRSDMEWAQRQSADNAWKLIASGKSSADIQRENPRLWRSLDGRDQMAILNDEKQRIDGGKTPTDWGRYYELKQMAKDDPEGFRNLPLTQDFDKLGPTERKELINLQQSAPNSADDLDATTLSNQVSLATAGWPTKSEDDKARKGKFERMVIDEVNARNKSLGRKLNQDERQQVIDDLMIEGEVRDGGMWNSDKRRFELSDTERVQFVPTEIREAFDAIPEADKLQIKQALAAKKLPQTPENILNVYRLGQQ